MAKFNFTKASIEKLELPIKRWIYHHDSQTRGLVIGIGSTGLRTFYLYRKIDGKPERIKLGAYPDMTIANARDKAAENNALIANGGNTNAVKRALRGELTLSQLFDEYIEKYAVPHKLKTIDDMKANFTRYLAPLSNRKLSSITKQEVQRLHTALGADKGSHTANRTLELLRAVINKGKSWGHTTSNPTAGIEKFKLKSRDRFVQSDELPRFFESLQQEPNETIRDFVLLSLLTGARKTNVLEMAWKHINFDLAVWHIPETKNGNPHDIPLTDEALNILRTRLKANPDGCLFVFSGDGKTGHLVSPKKAWAKILERAGLKNLRLHDLRRTMGSWQAATGASLVVIGKTLGHTDVKSTAIYSRLSLDPVREAMKLATNAMMLASSKNKIVE